MDVHPRPLHHRHPAPGPRGRRREQLPVREPPGLLRADLHRHRGHAPVTRASPPGSRWATSRAPTTPSPTSTTCRPRTPTPGSRCGSRATAGRTSIPPPWCPWPIPRPGRCWPTAPPGSSPICPGSPSVRAGRGWRPSWSWAGGAAAAHRPGPTRWPRTSSGAGPGRGRRRRTDETLSAYGERLAAADPATGPGLLAAPRLVERSTYGGIEPTADQIAAALAFTRRFAARGGRGRSGGPGPRSARNRQDRATAKASSNEAPAASSGR